MSSVCTIAAPPAAAGRRLFSLGTVLFLCGLIPGIYELTHADGFGFGRGFEMVATARSVADHGTFGNPFEPHLTGPTAANPPLYPLFLAALIKIFGEPAFVVPALAVNILLNAAMPALLPRLSAILWGDSLPGIFAAIFSIFALRLLPQWDTTCTMAGLLVFCLLTAREVQQSRSGVWAGIVGGVVTLLNPSTVFIFVPWVVYLLLARRVARRQALRYFTVLLVTVAACNLPWIVRNYRIWHAPVLRTNFGYTIYSSNNDCAQSTLYANAAAGCYEQTHPVGSAAEIRLLQNLGEVQYDRRRAADTLRWIRSHPSRFGELTRARFVEFWFPDPRIAPRAAYAVWVITALSFPGILLLARRRETVPIYILAVWLLYPLMFYIVVSCDRYRFPMLWTSALPAGYCAARLWSRARIAWR